jgi:uncharacterized protein (TIGR02147 family)
MPNILDYIDYRLYLQRCYEERKEKNPRYSYEAFTRHMGFSNRGFMYNILKGVRKLSKAHCYMLSRGLRHTKDEAVYFETIVAYAQAKNDEERTHYLEHALLISKGMSATPACLLRMHQYEYLSKWHHSAVRQFIEIEPFTGDFLHLSRKLSPSITKEQAKRSVQLLERLGFIAKGRDGVYYMTESKIKAGEEISQAARCRYHSAYTELARQSIREYSPDTHEVLSLTLGLSERTLEIIKKETKQFKDRIIELANNEKRVDRVYQYQLILFPLTRRESPD